MKPIVEVLIDNGFKDWVDVVLTEGSGDIDSSFMGFTNIYYHLSKIIPKGRCVIDLGCAYASQAIYFQDHKQYIGVDISDCMKPPTKNSIYYKMSIKEFIESKLPKIKRFYGENGIFAICSFVPPWGDNNEKLTRENFNHCFVFYTNGESDHNKKPTYERIARNKTT